VPQSSFDDTSKQIRLIVTQNGIAFKAEGKFVKASDEARCRSEAKQMERYGHPQHVRWYAGTMVARTDELSHRHFRRNGENSPNALILDISSQPTLYTL
jgi:hypothetical protein